ncbi:MAG: succinyl-diaminopimelate desuccinylase [Devosia sp.]
MSDLSPPAADPIALVKALIRCPSVTPTEAGVLDVLATALASLGFDVSRLRFEGDGSYPVDNLFATRAAPGGKPGPHLLFAGHTDVVPPGDPAAWTYPPFEAREAEGRVYGRGAADMKSGIAAFVAAIAQELQEGGLNAGRVSLAITNDEEAESINGTEKILAWAAGEGHRFDFSIVGEPSSIARPGDSIKIGRRGSLNGLATVTGIQGHVAYPERALNPVPVLARVVSALSGPLDSGNAHFPPTNLEFTSVDVGNPTTNLIPLKAEGRFNVRFNTGFTPETLLERLRQRVAEVEANNPAAARARIDLAILQRPSVAFLTEQGAELDRLCALIERETGQRPELSTAGGTSDARFIARYCPVVEFGLPGPSMHKTDESVLIADLLALTGLYRAFIAGYLAAPKDGG